MIFKIYLYIINIMNSSFENDLNNEDVNVFYKNYSTDDIKTPRVLSKYEKTRVLIERTQQLANGAEPLIKDVDRYSSIEEIAINELKEGKLPFIIKRYFNNKYEYLKIDDLNYLLK